MWLKYNHNELAETIELAEEEALKTDLYEASSISALEECIETSMNIYTTGTWEEVDVAIVTLNEAIENMKVKIGAIKNYSLHLRRKFNLTLLKLWLTKFLKILASLVVLVFPNARWAQSVKVMDSL